MIRIMHGRLKRMDTLVNDLLTFSKVGSDIEPQAIDLNTALQTALDNLESVIHQTGASVVVGQLPKVLGLETNCIILFQNLISNAIKFRSEIDPPVTVNSTRDSEHFHISVTDNGIGVDSKDHAYIFKPLTRFMLRVNTKGLALGSQSVKNVSENARVYQN